MKNKVFILLQKSAAANTVTPVVKRRMISHIYIKMISDLLLNGTNMRKIYKNGLINGK